MEDIVFLDANVLFSAAYRDDAGIRVLWREQGIRLVSSPYAMEEARRNLEPDRRGDLEELARGLDLVSGMASTEGLNLPDPGLPEKDLPIILGAIHARATHLLTGDTKHFGHLYGRKVGGVLVLTPGDYLRAREAEKT